MIVIGVDPPVSVNCGWAVVSLKDDKPELLEKFTQVLDPTNKDANLEAIYTRFSGLLNQYNSKILCMERQMGTGFAFGRAKLNEFVGVLKLCAFRAGVKVIEVSPAHLKMIIAGHGKAPKDYIMDNIVSTFGLTESGPEHECDATAFAMTYFIDNGWTGYQIAKPYTKEICKADKDAKALRKKNRAEKKAAREKAEAKKAKV